VKAPVLRVVFVLFIAGCFSATQEADTLTITGGKRAVRGERAAEALDALCGDEEAVVVSDEIDPNLRRSWWSRTRVVTYRCPGGE
jgi:hypothetical protein